LGHSSSPPSHYKAASWRPLSYDGAISAIQRVFSCILWSHGSLSTSRLTASSRIASASRTQLIAPQSAQIKTGIFTRHETYPFRVRCRNASSCTAFTTIPRRQKSQTPVSFPPGMAQNLFGQPEACQIWACQRVKQFTFSGKMPLGFKRHNRRRAWSGNARGLSTRDLRALAAPDLRRSRSRRREHPPVFVARVHEGVPKLPCALVSARPLPQSDGSTHTCISAVDDVRFSVAEGTRGVKHRRRSTLPETFLK
jgi:hypothetical protein